jgi:hypothetical protein
MTIGTCRRDGCDNPRRMRRGLVEPLCEECYRRARDKVARELAEEAASDRPARYRKMKLVPGRRPPDRAPERVAPVAGAGARPLDAGARSQRPVRVGDASAGSRTRCISEELLCEARRLYALGLSLRAVTEALLDETSYANAHSAEVALRFQFKRRGWPLRTRAQARRARRQR